jgi:cytidine deaminase
MLDFLHMHTGTENLEQLVTSELTHARGPVSGYVVACGLLTENGFYLGHNVEQEGSMVFQHAEDMAIQKMVGKEAAPHIKKIIMLGGGRAKKFKNYIPCVPCSEELSPYTSEETVIQLLPLKGMGESFSFSFGELTHSYLPASPSKFSSVSEDDYLAELKEKTVLRDEDRRLVAKLARYGATNGVEIYLTGSATGRGGVSTFLMERNNIPYHDVDLIAATKRNPPEVEREIESIIKECWGPLKKEVRTIITHYNPKGVMRARTYYYCGKDDEKVLDFTLATDHDGAFIHPWYEPKNWFHRLS